MDEADDGESDDCVRRAGSEEGASEVGVAGGGVEEGEAKPWRVVVTKLGGLGVSDTGFVGWGESGVDVDGRSRVSEGVEKTMLVTVSVTVAVTVWTLPGSCRSRRIGRLGPYRGPTVPGRTRLVAIHPDVSCSSNMLSFKLQ